MSSDVYDALDPKNSLKKFFHKMGQLHKGSRTFCIFFSKNLLKKWIWHERGQPSKKDIRDAIM
jgi:hypothetical protein